MLGTGIFERKSPPGSFAVSRRENGVRVRRVLGRGARTFSDAGCPGKTLNGNERTAPRILPGRIRFLQTPNADGGESLPFRRSRALEEKMLNTYCLFCETAKCGYVARAARQKLGCRALQPKQVQHTWSGGKPVDIERDLLPGYVFLYLEDERLDVAAARSIQGVIRCLCSTDRRYELAGSDEQFALMLLHKDGVIGKTKVYEEGQRIRICKGVYEGVDTKILKVDRRRGRMQIEIPFANMPVKTWVEFEVVEDDGAD